MYFILSANAWMKHPVGYAVDHTTGQARLTDIWAVLIQWPAVVEYLHTFAGSLIVAGAFVAAVSAYRLLRAREVDLFRPVLRAGLVVTLVGGALEDAIGPKKTAPAQSGAPGAPAAPASTVDVLNANGRPGLAAKVASALSGAGYTTGNVGNALPRIKTVVHYGSGADSDAKKIAGLFGVVATADPALSAGHVEIDLGRYVIVPHVPAAGGKKAVAPAPASHKPVAIPTDGVSGGAVKGGGIPCIN